MKRNRDMGEKREGDFFFFFFHERGRSYIGIYYIILVGNIFSFNE